MRETFEHMSKELSIGAVHVFNLDLTAWLHKALTLRLIIQIFCNLSIRYHGIFLHSVMDNFDNVRLTGIGNLKIQGNRREQLQKIALLTSLGNQAEYV